MVTEANHCVCSEGICAISKIGSLDAWSLCNWKFTMVAIFYIWYFWSNIRMNQSTSCMLFWSKMSFQNVYCDLDPCINVYCGSFFNLWSPCYSKSKQWSVAVKMWECLLFCVVMYLCIISQSECESCIEENLKIYDKKKHLKNTDACLFLHINCIFLCPHKKAYML